MAAIADGLDGSLARHMGGSEIGGTLDSLADVISFGVAPATIIFSYMSGYFMLIAVCFYLICGILRLARFTYLNLTVLFSKACLSQQAE